MRDPCVWIRIMKINDPIEPVGINPQSVRGGVV